MSEFKFPEAKIRRLKGLIEKLERYKHIDYRQKSILLKVVGYIEEVNFNAASDFLFDPKVRAVFNSTITREFYNRITDIVREMPGKITESIKINIKSPLPNSTHFLGDYIENPKAEVILPKNMNLDLSKCQILWYLRANLRDGQPATNIMLDGLLSANSTLYRVTTAYAPQEDATLTIRIYDSKYNLVKESAPVTIVLRTKPLEIEGAVLGPKEIAEDGITEIGFRIKNLQMERRYEYRLVVSGHPLEYIRVLPGSELTASLSGMDLGIGTHEIGIEIIDAYPEFEGNRRDARSGTVKIIVKEAQGVKIESVNGITPKDKFVKVFRPNQPLGITIRIREKGEVKLNWVVYSLKDLYDIPGKIISRGEREPFTVDNEKTITLSLPDTFNDGFYEFFCRCETHEDQKEAPHDTVRIQIEYETINIELPKNNEHLNLNQAYDFVAEVKGIDLSKGYSYGWFASATLKGAQDRFKPIHLGTTSRDGIKDNLKIEPSAFVLGENFIWLSIKDGLGPKKDLVAKPVKVIVEEKSDFKTLAMESYLILLDNPLAPTALRPIDAIPKVAGSIFEDGIGDQFIIFAKNNANTTGNEGFLFPTPLPTYSNLMSDYFPSLTSENYEQEKQRIEPLAVRKREDELWELSERNFASKIIITSINGKTPSKNRYGQNVIEIRQDDQKIRVEGIVEGNGNIKLQGSLIDFKGAGKYLNSGEIRLNNVSTTSNFLLVIPEVLTPGRYTFKIRAYPPQKDEIVGDGVSITITPAGTVE